jgi:hypothetical protein
MTAAPSQGRSHARSSDLVVLSRAFGSYRDIGAQDGAAGHLNRSPASATIAHSLGRPRRISIRPPTLRWWRPISERRPTSVTLAPSSTRRALPQSVVPRAPAPSTCRRPPRLTSWPTMEARGEKCRVGTEPGVAHLPNAERRYLPDHETTCTFRRERATGIEPAFSAWEAVRGHLPELERSKKSLVHCGIDAPLLFVVAPCWLLRVAGKGSKSGCCTVLHARSGLTAKERSTGSSEMRPPTFTLPNGADV